MGNTPIPIYNNRQEMTERLYTNQQEQQQEGYKVYDEPNRLPLVLWGIWVLLPLKSGRTPRMTVQGEVRGKME